MLSTHPKFYLIKIKAIICLQSYVPMAQYCFNCCVVVFLRDSTFRPVLILLYRMASDPVNRVVVWKFHQFLRFFFRVKEIF